MERKSIATCTRKAWSNHTIGLPETHRHAIQLCPRRRRAACGLACVAVLCRVACGRVAGPLADRRLETRSTCIGYCTRIFDFSVRSSFLVILVLVIAVFLVVLLVALAPIHFDLQEEGTQISEPKVS